MVKAMTGFLGALCLSAVLLCAAVLLQPDRDPALTGHEPTEPMEDIHGVFAVHGDLLREAAAYFGQHHEAFDVIRDEGEVSSGFFASDVDARAIRWALDEDGAAIVRRLNEEAYLRSVVYYRRTQEQAPALLFGFCTRKNRHDLLIYVDPAGGASGAATVISRLSAEHGALLPLAAPGWYYIEEYSIWHAR